MSINKQQRNAATRKLDISAPVLRGSRSPQGSGHVSKAEILDSMLQNGAVRIVSGLLVDKNSIPLTESSVNKMSDLILLTDPIYDGMSILVKNPGNNVSNYFPARAFRMNSRWYLENGDALYYAKAPRLRTTWPAAAWGAGTITKATAAAGAQTQLTSTAAHALTTANQVTLGNTYVYVAGSTGAGSVDWTVGWTKITAITDLGNDFTLLHPYNINLRTPVITCIGAGILSAVEALRIPIPPFSDIGGYDALVSVKNYIAANEHRAKVWACAAGTSLATLFAQSLPVTGLLNNVNDVAASPLGFRCGLQNAGATNLNVATGAIVSATGLGLGTGAAGYSTPNIQTNVPTELVVTFESGTGVDITMELVSLIIRWRY